MAMEAGILLEGLGKRYGDKWALRNLTLQVKPGQIVGLLGPNGAGKSTTMRMLTGLLEPTEGKATVNGMPVASSSTKWKVSLGYLPEQNPLYRELYVREYLAYVAQLYHLRHSEQAIARAIHLTGLGPEQYKKIAHLSKGYKQRVGLAAALIHSPKTLILDEPTSGLDPNQMAEIRSMIRNLGHSTAILLSSHIMQEVEATCDQVAIIQHGNLVAQGDTATVMRQQAGNTLIFAFAQDVEPTLLQQWFPQAQLEARPNHEWALHINSHEDLRAQLFTKAVQAHLTLITLYQRVSHMEEVFRALTQETTPPGPEDQ